MIKTTLKIGRYPIGIEAEKADHFFLLCGIFSKVPDKCGNCQSDDIFPNGEKKQGENWVFCSIRCRSCGYQLRFGKRRDDGQFFIKEDEGWVAPFRPGGDGDSSSSRRSSGNNSSSDAYAKRDDGGGSGTGTHRSSGGYAPAPPDDDVDQIPF